MRHDAQGIVTVNATRDGSESTDNLLKDVHRREGCARAACAIAVLSRVSCKPAVSSIRLSIKGNMAAWVTFLLSRGETPRTPR